MLMKDDKKAGAVMGQPEEINEHVVAAEEILKAIEQKDPQALAEAMRAMVSMCQYEEEPQD